MSAGAALGADIAARLDLTTIETPCFVTDLGALEKNLALLADVQARAGCTIILALKGFAQWSTFPLVKRYLRGTTASSVAEARLGKEEMGGEVHAYAPAWTADDLREVCELADHIVFNSPGQWHRLRRVVDAARAVGRVISCGLRCNPEHREVEVALYDPAAPDGLLAALRRCLTEDLSAIGAAGFERVRSRTWQAAAAQTIAVYRAALDE